ncbi:MAG: serine hydrolase [Parcubacteria group bacterium]
MRVNRLPLYIILLLASFFIFQNARASIVDTVIVNLDKPTLAKGYTVKSADKQLWLPIFAGQSAKNLTVRISRVSDETPLPDNTRAITGRYIYSVEADNPDDFNKPVLLSFAFQCDDQYDKAIYLYDVLKQEWKRLDSIVDYKNKLIKAHADSTGAEAAVLENMSDELTAESAIVIDKNTGEAFFEKNSDEVRSAASLTKLMSALVFLEHNPGWEKVVTMQKADFVGGASLYAKVGDKVKVKDLFNAALVGSQNNSMMALARSTGLGKDQFVSLMNMKAKDFDLEKTFFVEPTGLDEKNVSTAKELAVIAQNAFSKPEILKATTTQSYKVPLVNRKVLFTVQNTNKKILTRDLCVTGSKTGWTDEAGYNLVTQAKNDSHELIALVLGAKITRNYEEVYQLLKKYL